MQTLNKRALWREKGRQHIISGERSGGGSHWGKWRGGSVLSGTRGKESVGPGEKTLKPLLSAKQKEKQQPSAGIAQIACAITLLLISERISVRL